VPMGTSCKRPYERHVLDCDYFAFARLRFSKPTIAVIIPAGRSSDSFFRRFRRCIKRLSFLSLWLQSY
jgi:hypothetical protein